MSKGCTATVKGMWELLQTGRLVGGVEMEAVWRGLMAFDMYWDVTWCGETDDDGENGSVDGVNKGLSNMGRANASRLKNNTMTFPSFPSFYNLFYILLVQLHNPYSAGLSTLPGRYYFDYYRLANITGYTTPSS